MSLRSVPGGSAAEICSAQVCWEGGWSVTANQKSGEEGGREVERGRKRTHGAEGVG